MIKTYQIIQADDPHIVAFDYTISLDLASVAAVYHVPSERRSVVHLSEGGDDLYIYGAAAAEVLADFQARDIDPR